MAPKGNGRQKGQGRKLTRQAVKSMIFARKEHKAFAVANAIGTAFVASGTGFRVSGGVISGDTSTQRDGAQIRVHKLDVFFNSRGSAASNSAIRILVVQDKQANAADMSAQQLLNSADYYSQYHPVIQSEQKRFHILADKFVTLSFNGMNEQHMVLNLKPLQEVTYLDTTDVSTACGKNFIWIWVFGNNTSASYTLTTTQHFTDS